MDSPSISIRLLGDFGVDVNGRAIPPDAWRLRKAADLVKLLALAPGHRVHRDQLLDTLWPDKDPDAAANNLYQAIHNARKAIAAGPNGPGLELRDGVLSLGPAKNVRVDVADFEAALRRADAGEIGARDEARALYRGELLPDDRYEDWAAAPRDVLAAGHRRNLSELARIREIEGDLEAALECLRALVEVDSTDEAAGRRIMQLEARAGRRGAAQQQYATLRDALRRELDVEPDEETTRLARDIVEGLLDPLGERRSTTNLPVQFTSFIGRQREVREVQRLLLGARLLTLTGTGGTGKTRLAFEAAQAIRGTYPDGVWLVELAAIRRSEDVARAAAETFGVREAPGTPLLDGVIRQIGERRLLLLLDNCEHLADPSASLSNRLLATCPNLRILATSRQPLRSPGEVLFRVSSLPVPDPDEALPASEVALIDSVRLFADRARAVDTAFSIGPANAAAVARLCFHLDGLPLAIELAASRIATIPVELLLEHLGQRFDLLVGGSRTALTRQQTLRATIDWSYDLLSPRQQAVLRAMSVFGGRISPEAVEAVCFATGLRSGELLAILGELVDQSLVVLDTSAGSSRFRLLDTVREYAHERLVASGDSDRVEAAQIAWAVEVASETAAGLPGDRWADGLRRLALEQDGLRAALDRALRSSPGEALQLVDALWSYWLWDGDLEEGRRWLSRALNLNPEPSPARGRALVGLAALSGRSGDPVEHARSAREAAEIFRAIGDLPAACRALLFLGCAPWAADDLGESEKIFQTCLDLASDAGFQAGRAAALNGLAVVSYYRSDPHRSKRLFDESLITFGADTSADLTPQVLDLGELVLPEPATRGFRLVFQETFGSFRDVPPRVAAGYVLGNRGMLARIQGNLDRAAMDIEASLSTFRELGDERAIAQALGRLGNLAIQVGDIARARQMLVECLEIRRRLGDSRGVSLTEANLGNLEVAAGRLDRAEDLLMRSVGAFRRRGDAWGLAAATANLGSLALARGKLDQANAFLEESLQAAATTGRQRWVAWRLLELAGVADLAGDADTGQRRRGEAGEIFRSLGDAAGEAQSLVVGR